MMKRCRSYLFGLLLMAWLMPSLSILLATVVYADDCGRYLQNPASLVITPKVLVEDCMRTGYSQALATGIVSGIAGGAIANALVRALRNTSSPTQPPPEEIHPPPPT